MLLEAAIERYAVLLRAQGRSPHTVASYVGDARLFAAWLVEVRGVPVAAGDIATDDVARFLGCDRVTKLADGRAKAPGSIAKICASLRALFRHLTESGTIESDPARSIRRRSPPPAPPAILTPAEEKRLLKTVRTRVGEAAERDRLMLELLLGTGIRLSSLVGLDVEDVRLDDKRINVHVKGGRVDGVFVKTDLRRLLRVWLRDAARAGHVSGPVFRSARGTRISPRQVQLRVAHWLAEAGIEKPITVHSMRHTFGTNLYRRTHDLRLVQRALGHRQVTTTQIYTHLADDALEEAVEGM